MKTFEQLGLSAETLAVLRARGFESPTPIQEQTIPALLSGLRDMVGQAQTGTGKTAAFSLPIIERISGRSDVVTALILTPTRELAIQVAEEINALKGRKDIQVLPVYGGQSISLQLRRLKKGVDIVVGTPGRILDHLERRSLRLENISYLVLDEADEMLNMGFLEDVQKIMQQTNPQKRTLLFSATMPPEIMRIARTYMGEYDVVKTSPDRLTVSRTDQIYFEVSDADKFEALCRIIDFEDAFYGLIFCRTKVDVDNVAQHLVSRGYEADALHGDISQEQREKILQKLKKSVITILVATDVAARGIDVRDLTHVINYSLPQDPQAYVHRIGRTGRAGKDGIAITFVTPAESRKLRYISRQTKSEIRKAKLPQVSEVISSKKSRVKTYLEEIVAEGIAPEYQAFARKLSKSIPPEELTAALLQYTFGNEFNEESYAPIKENNFKTDTTTRLFVTQGKRHGLTPRKLISFITDVCRVSGRVIGDMQIREDFSFVSLPFPEAEQVLAVMKQKKRGKGNGLYITRAKDKR